MKNLIKHTVLSLLASGLAIPLASWLWWKA